MVPVCPVDVSVRYFRGVEGGAITIELAQRNSCGPGCPWGYSDN